MYNNNLGKKLAVINKAIIICSLMITEVKGICLN